jgi:hypothetical protein
MEEERLSINPWYIAIPVFAIGVGLAYYLGTKNPTAGHAPAERAYPPYQNQMSTYSTSGYAEDQFQTHIAFGKPNAGIELNPGVPEGKKPWAGQTRSY